ncbi:MAG: dimethylarginine dimethylaminohydrolase family protein, partial [Geminicoccaceae bacterium]
EAAHLGVLQQGRSQLYPADPVFVIGKHFLEISIRRAYRRKEVFPLRDLVLPMIEVDPEAHHVAMPQLTPHAPASEGPGPFLEGGDILIHGQDIFVGVGELCTDWAGVAWLKRYIERFGYRVHAMPIKGPILHALGIMCLLREGLLMAHRPALAEGLPEPLRDWEVIDITAAEMHAHATVGVSLDHRRYMIDPQFSRIMDQLDRHAIEPLPTPCDAIGFWGGAIRCVTLPLARDPA